MLDECLIRPDTDSSSLTGGGDTSFNTDDPRHSPASHSSSTTRTSTPKSPLIFHHRTAPSTVSGGSTPSRTAVSSETKMSSWSFHGPKHSAKQTLPWSTKVHRCPHCSYSSSSLRPLQVNIRVNKFDTTIGDYNKSHP